MSRAEGLFVWYELMTTDPAAAEAFYTSVTGWRAEDAGMPGITGYTLLTTGGRNVAGLMALPEAVRESGGRPGWLGYVWADDVDAMTERVRQAGGAVHRAPEDIPGVGRFAVVADPQGAVFCLFRGAGEDGDTLPGLGAPRAIGWHELMATDWSSSFDFYAGLFGWTKDQAIDTGGMGVYQLFAKAGGEAMGGMMSLSPGMPGPYWLYYLVVDAIDAAVARVEAGGGQVIFGPAEVPGGAWIIQGFDPQGAMFALVASRR